MRMRSILIAAAAIAASFAGGADAPAIAHAAAPSKSKPRSCSRVCRRLVHERWRRAVRRYGRGLLAARRRCESGSHGYNLSTNGNGYWFAYQFDAAAWRGAGGRVHGRPVGRWTRQPTPLEQDYRAVTWDRIHQGDPWPNCP